MGIYTCTFVNVIIFNAREREREMVVVDRFHFSRILYIVLATIPGLLVYIYTTEIKSALTDHEICCQQHLDLKLIHLCCKNSLHRYQFHFIMISIKTCQPRTLLLSMMKFFTCCWVGAYIHCSFSLFPWTKVRFHEINFSQKFMFSIWNRVYLNQL